MKPDKPMPANVPVDIVRIQQEKRDFILRDLLEAGAKIREENKRRTN